MLYFCLQLVLYSRVTVVLLPLLTFAIYLPSLFRYEVVKCVLYSDGSITYYKRDNLEFLQTMFYSVSEERQIEKLLILFSCFIVILFCRAMLHNSVQRMHVWMMWIDVSKEDEVNVKLTFFENFLCFEKFLNKFNKKCQEKLFRFGNTLS